MTNVRGSGPARLSPAISKNSIKKPLTEKAGVWYYSAMINDNPMYEKYVEVSWCPADVKEMRPDWSDEKCQEMLGKVSNYFQDSFIESGWEILEIHLAMQEQEDEELCDECGEPMGDDQSPNVKTMCVYCEDEMLGVSNEIN